MLVSAEADTEAASAVPYIVAGMIAGAVIALSALITVWIPFIGLIIGWALGLIGSLVEVYVVAGIVIQILVFAKVIKEDDISKI